MKNCYKFCKHLEIVNVIYAIIVINRPTIFLSNNFVNNTKRVGVVFFALCNLGVDDRDALMDGWFCFIILE